MARVAPGGSSRGGTRSHPGKGCDSVSARSSCAPERRQNSPGQYCSIGIERRACSRGGGRARLMMVVVGDLLLDVLLLPELTHSEQPAGMLARSGGSAANTAAWMGHLGRPVVFVG